MNEQNRMSEDPLGTDTEAERRAQGHPMPETDATFTTDPHISDEQLRGDDDGLPVPDERSSRRTVEEDLTAGPTPETRRAMGEPESDFDTSDGPTPETRAAVQSDR